MVQEQIKTIPVKEAFTKGFIEDIGKNNITPQFAGYVRNARLLNKTITIRLGRNTIENALYPGYVQGMVFNKELLFNANGKLCRLGGIIGNTANNDVNFIVYGKYTIVLTGVGNPFVFDGLGIVQVADAQMPFFFGGGGCPLKPIIGASFTGFTMFAGNDTGYDNIMYISKPIIRDVTGQTYSSPADWAINTTNTPPAQQGNTPPRYSGEARAMRSKILGMVANYNNLYVFCQDSIETLGAGNATTVGGIVTLFTQPIGDGDRLCSSRALVSAGDKVLYMTKALKIKTVNFIPGKADPEIGDLSDRPGQSIQGFIDRELNRDQSRASAVYVKRDNTIRFYVRSLLSNFANDLCIVYDLDTDSFVVDNNKFFAISVQGDDDKVYAGSHLATDIYQDDAGYSDSGVPIIFEYDTPNYGMGSPNFAKQFRGYTIAGALNQTTQLTLVTYIDGVQKSLEVVGFSSIDPTELGTINIGGPNIGPGQNSLYPFEFTVDHGQIRNNGKKIRIQILCSSAAPAFYLDSLSFIVRPKGRYELNDVL